MTGAPAWFARVGHALDAGDRDALAAFVRAQGFRPQAPIAMAGSWWEAARVVRESTSDDGWWDYEEAERECLWESAARVLGEADLALRLDAEGGRLAQAIRTAAGCAAAKAGVGDPQVVAAAVADALLATHQRALARLAGADPAHWFVAKFDVFARGRWPLGFRGEGIVVF